jgi:hypothetical protein
MRFVALTLGAAGCLGQVQQEPGAEPPATPAPPSNETDAHCALPFPILAGAGYHLTFSIGSVSTPFTARADVPGIAEVGSANAQCSCSAKTPNGFRAQGVKLDEACAAGEERSCVLVVDIASNAPGDMAIDIFDAAGTPFRHVAVQVREVASIGLESRLEAPGDSDEGFVRFGNGAPLAPGADGAVEVPVGGIVQVTPTFLDAAGRTLRFDARGGFARTADDGSILDGALPFAQPRIDWPMPFRYRAVKAGTSVVTVDGRGVRADVTVRVQ